MAPRVSESGGGALPIVAAVEMGYGHLRAAHALASELGTETVRADRPPHAAGWELALWNVSRRFYEGVSRGSQRRLLAPVLRPTLEALTRIEPRIETLDGQDLARPTVSARHLALLARRGFGAGPAAEARAAGVPLVATFFVPALAADAAGHRRTYCVVTDCDLSRAWVPADARASSIRFLAGTAAAARRLRAYGVPEGSVTFTGYPLPGELLGGRALETLRANLAARLGRLDPGGGFLEDRREEVERKLGRAVVAEPRGGASGPLHLALAVGGAGAQAELARRVFGGLRSALEAGSLRLTLIAGIRAEVAERFGSWIRRSGLEGSPVEVLVEPDLDSYFRRFNRLLAETDLLWTKPSELSFFAALGLPLLLAPPVGAHERCNRSWLLERGAALDAGDPATLGARLAAARDGGALARAAWAGYRRLPKRGLYRILETVTE